MHMTRTLLAASAIALGCAAPAAHGQTYPSKPVTAIIAFPPGAPNDLIMRITSDPFRAALKQTLVVENRPGAGGNIAAEFVSRAAPDAYTLIATIDTVVTVNPNLYKTSTFRADTDLTPVIYLANTAQTLVCNPAVPVKSAAELADYARSHSMSFASGGLGVPGHLAAELFMAATGVKMTHIPYKRPGPATQDVLAGVVPCGFLATPVVMPHVKSGKLTALAVTSPKRSPIAPEVPTDGGGGHRGRRSIFRRTAAGAQGHAGESGRAAEPADCSDPAAARHSRADAGRGPGLRAQHAATSQRAAAT
jgi:tripartite-type tricarboxylate transporter receptor subunit TctC